MAQYAIPRAVGSSLRERMGHAEKVVGELQKVTTRMEGKMDTLEKGMTEGRMIGGTDQKREAAGAKGEDGAKAGRKSSVGAVDLEVQNLKSKIEGYDKSLGPLKEQADRLLGREDSIKVCWF